MACFAEVPEAEINMANGKPGDDPILDILVYQRRGLVGHVYSPTVDSLIGEILDLGGERELRSRFNIFAPPPLDEFEEQLRSMRDRMKQDARERGWEVD